MELFFRVTFCWIPNSGIVTFTKKVVRDNIFQKKWLTSSSKSIKNILFIVLYSRRKLLILIHALSHFISIVTRHALRQALLVVVTLLQRQPDYNNTFQKKVTHILPKAKQIHYYMLLNTPEGCYYLFKNVQVSPYKCVLQDIHCNNGGNHLVLFVKM